MRSFFTYVIGTILKWIILVQQKPKLEDLLSNPFNVNDMQEICTTNQIGKDLVLFSKNTISYLYEVGLFHPSDELSIFLPSVIKRKSILDNI